MRSVGNGRMVSNNEITLKAWRQDIAVNAMAVRPVEWPRDAAYRLTVTFLFKRPKAHISKKGGVVPSAPPHHTKAPDLDKLCRAIGDAISITGILMDNDSSIVEIRAVKKYCVGGAPAGCFTRLEVLP